MNGVTHKDDKFYMNFVTFKVENCLFRVPRCTLESQSKVFRDMFLLPTPEGELEGSSDEKPICLHGIKANEFRPFLRVLFKSTFGPQDNLPSSPEEWVSVIKLARMWEFDGVFENSAEKVAYDSVKLSPVEKVALAFQYNIEEWLVPGLYELANRPEPIGTKDVDILGLDVALKVAAVRESLRLKMEFGSGAFISGSRNARMIDFTRTIKKIFEMPGGDSLEMDSDVSSEYSSIASEE